MRQTLIRDLYILDLWCLSVLKLFLLIKILESVFQVSLLHFIAHLSHSFVQLLCNFFILLRPQTSLGARSFISLRQGHISERCGDEAPGPGGTCGQPGAFKGGCRSAVMSLQAEIKWKAVVNLALCVSFSLCYLEIR